MNAEFLQYPSRASQLLRAVPLVAILIGGVLGTLTPANSPNAQENKSNAEHNQSSVDQKSSGLPAIRAWATDNHDAIEALSALGSVIFSVVLTGSTVLLWVATNKQARITNDALKLSRDEFVSTWRPKLRVRNIVVSRTPKDRELQEIFMPGKALECRFYISNVGGTPTRITEAFGMAFQSQVDLPMARPYEGKGGNLFIPAKAIRPGQSVPMQFVSDWAMDESSRTIGARTIGHQRLFVMGWIVYVDDIGIERRTAFCREFKRKTDWDGGRFNIVKNPDYEHEE